MTMVFLKQIRHSDFRHSKNEKATSVRCTKHLFARLCLYKTGVQVSSTLLKAGVYSNLSLTDGFVSATPHLNPPPAPPTPTAWVHHQQVMHT